MFLVSRIFNWDISPSCGIITYSSATSSLYVGQKIQALSDQQTINIQNHINTFAASYLNTQGLNNSCLKSPASTLVDLTFQSRALRSFSLNQLRNLSL